MTLRADVRTLQTRIDAADLSFLADRFMQEGYSREQFEQAVSGLKKFFSLALYHDGPLAVTSRLVDDLWHTFILFTPQYRAFCENIFGGYFDHQTHTEQTPVSGSAFPKFIEAYQFTFGIPPDDMWLGDLPAPVRTAALEGRVPHELNFQWSGWPGRP